MFVEGSPSARQPTDPALGPAPGGARNLNPRLLPGLECRRPPCHYTVCMTTTTLPGAARPASYYPSSRGGARTVKV